jgi:hypothetical protein
MPAPRLNFNQVPKPNAPEANFATKTTLTSAPGAVLSFTIPIIYPAALTSAAILPIAAGHVMRNGVADSCVTATVTGTTITLTPLVPTDLNLYTVGDEIMVMVWYRKV